MANTPVIKGSSGMTRVNSGCRWSIELGETYFEEWQGPSAAASAFYLTKKQSKEWDNITLNSFPVRSVTLEKAVDDSDNANNEPVWEIDAVELMKPLEVHPYFVCGSPGVGKTLTEWKASFDKALRQATSLPAASGDYVTNEQRYGGLRGAGVDSYIDLYVVIRKTQIVSRANTVVAAQWNKVNKVVPLDYINPPADIIGQLTDIERIKRNPVDPATLGTYEKAKWEWLTKAPRIKNEAGGKKRSIIQEWWGAEEWSTVFYGGSWDPQTP
jgi:hypothetical protein